MALTITHVVSFDIVNSTSSGVLHVCNFIKLPLPRYTVISILGHLDVWVVLDQIAPHLRCTNTCFSISLQSPRSISTSPLWPSITVSS